VGMCMFCTFAGLQNSEILWKAPRHMCLHWNGKLLHCLEPRVSSNHIWLIWNYQHDRILSGFHYCSWRKNQLVPRI